MTEEALFRQPATPAGVELRDASGGQTAEKSPMVALAGSGADTLGSYHSPPGSYEQPVHLMVSSGSDETRQSFATPERECVINREITLSEQKKKAIDMRLQSQVPNAHWEGFVSAADMAKYAKERVDDYSFLINEAYCVSETFCENCYRMRVELELFAEKFTALANSGNTANAGDSLFMSELESLYRNKEVEFSRLSMEHDVAVNRLSAEEVVFSTEEEKARQSQLMYEHEIKELKNQNKRLAEEIADLRTQLSILSERDKQAAEIINWWMHEARNQQVCDRSPDDRSEQNRHIAEGFSRLENEIKHVLEAVQSAQRSRVVEQKFAHVLKSFLKEAREGISSKNWEEGDVNCAITNFEAIFDAVFDDEHNVDVLIGRISEQRKARELELTQVLFMRFALCNSSAKRILSRSCLCVCVCVCVCVPATFNLGTAKSREQRNVSHPCVSPQI
ncbi:unnamed protein product [Gongylonema pulchrum]|uniref:Uncharacterized protein n=1 Tax=Gongylonema pulchrum TaxID=637853 RepID=A0A183DRW3_9BILA|nr:unnamed protein product [Gongylonema pulchrum]